LCLLGDRVLDQGDCDHHDRAANTAASQLAQDGADVEAAALGDRADRRQKHGQERLTPAPPAMPATEFQSVPRHLSFVSAPRHCRQRLRR
jgi:hypothetical protein